MNGQNEAFMTSPIGDLPINSEGMRKAIDYIAQLQCDKNELQEQVDELKGTVCELVADKCNLVVKVKHTVKDTVKEMIEEIDNIKEIFSNDIVGYEQAQGWCMCIDELKEIAKRKGIEVE